MNNIFRKPNGDRIHFSKKPNKFRHILQISNTPTRDTVHDKKNVTANVFDKNMQCNKYQFILW